jgi:tetratricopeptide (TPR) repeat protein
MKKIIFLLIIVISSPILYSQTQHEYRMADNLGQEAIELINTGKFNRAIELLDSAQRYNPFKIEYPYEKALAYYYKNDYKNSLNVLDSLISKNRINDMIFVLKSNCLSAMGQEETAMKVLNSSLEKFPYSGRIYAEIGLLNFALKKNNLAIADWEKGVAFAPDFGNNYYYLAKIYSMNYHFIWSMINGEIYILLSENKTKVTEISKNLYNVFNRSLFFKADSNSAPVIKFTFQGIKTDKPKPIRDLNFEMAYQEVMARVVPELIKGDSVKVSIAKISKIREEFIKTWFTELLNVNFNNMLFDWHRKLIENKYFEAYNYLIFKDGNIDEYNEWYKKNKALADEFMNWLVENPLMIDKAHNVQRINME